MIFPSNRVRVLVSTQPPFSRFGFAKPPAGRQVSTDADHMPEYRQSQILARAGLDLHLPRPAIVCPSGPQCATGRGLRRLAAGATPQDLRKIPVGQKAELHP